MDKENVVSKLEDAIASLERKLKRINDGDITFSEAGDWLHDWGDSIVSAMDCALLFIKEEAA